MVQEQPAVRRARQLVKKQIQKGAAPQAREQVF